MTKSRSRCLAPLFGIFAVIALSGCGADRLMKLKSEEAPQPLLSATSQVKFHSLDPQYVGNRTKFLFIIDKSGSNYFGDNGHDVDKPGEGNDPDGSRRFNSILNFVEAQKSKDAQGAANNYFGFISFNKTATVGSAFTNDSEAFKQAVLQHRPDQTADGYSTQYRLALAEAHQMIQEDIEAAAKNPDGTTTTYIVFHISDGFPDPVKENNLCVQCDHQIESDVKSLVGLQSLGGEQVNGIYLHTGYYYRDVADPDAEVLMKNMAEWGRGQSLVFSGTDPIDFTQFETPAARIVMRLVDVFMTNTTTVWEINESTGAAELRYDGDSDGISDQLEIALGSNPALADSDGNGVSDLVEYRKNGRPCRSGTCSPAFAMYYGACENAFKRTDQGTFPDTDGDGLNDCEEKLLGTDMRKFDSNGDWITDLLGFRAAIAIMPGTREDLIDADQDGLSNYNEVKLNTPVYRDNRKILDMPVYDYTLMTNGSDETGVSYSIDIRNIPTVGPKEKNKLRIHILERLDNTKNLRFLRVAEKNLNADGTIQFTNEDFGPPIRQCDDGAC